MSTLSARGSTTAPSGATAGVLPSRSSTATAAPRRDASLTPDVVTRTAERVGHDLHPVVISEQGATGDDDLLDSRQPLGDGREAESNALETCLTEIERGRVERQPVNGALDVLVPTRAAFAAEQ